MSRITIFLSRFLGLLMLTVSISFLSQPHKIIETVNGIVNDGTMIFMIAMISIAAGLAIVISHNVWTGGVIPVVVTILGWLFLIRGILLLTWPPFEIVHVYNLIQFGKYFYYYDVVMLIIGALLTYGGFKNRLSESE